MPLEEQKLQILTKASCVIVRISAFAAAEGRSKILKDDLAFGSERPIEDAF